MSVYLPYPPPRVLFCSHVVILPQVVEFLFCFFFFFFYIFFIITNITYYKSPSTKGDTEGSGKIPT
jgi:hypothetical protein